MSTTSTKTLAQLRTECRYKANMENSQFISDAELDTYINSSSYELYDLLVTTYGEDYYTATAYTLTTDGTNQLFDLPTDFYKLLGVDLALANSQDSFVTLKQFKFNERNRFAVPNIQTVWGATNLRYRIHGNKIMFNIIPAAGQMIKLWYIPKMTLLVADSDVLDGISGWYEYVTTDVAIKMLNKEESDISALALHKAELLKRINDSAPNRDAGMSQTVSDTSMGSDEWPNGGVGGSGWSW
jgi:hypothetical protein